MGWKEQQSGYQGGNAPHPNDTAGNYDYWQGQNRRNAEAEAARSGGSASTGWKPPSNDSSSTALLASSRSSGMIDPKSVFGQLLDTAPSIPSRAIALGVVVGLVSAYLPFFLSGWMEMSLYTYRVFASVTLTFVGIFWSISELRRSRPLRGGLTLLASYIVAQVFWFDTGRNFVQIYLLLWQQGLVHVAHSI